VALDVPVFRPHVVLEHPEISSLQRLLVVVVVEAVDQRSNSLLQLLFVPCNYVATFGLGVVGFGNAIGSNVADHLGGIAEGSGCSTTVIRRQPKVMQ